MIINDALLNVDKKQLKYLNFFWAGFIIYTLSFILSLSPYSTNLFHVIQLLSLVLVIVPAVPLIQFNIENKYLQIFFYLYLFWSLLVIVRGFKINPTFIKDNLYNARYGILPYLAPLIMLFPKNLTFYKKVFYVILILCAFNILFDALFIRDLLSASRENETGKSLIEFLGTTLSITAGFLLLTYTYHSNKINLLALGIIIITLLLAIIRARRGLTLIFSSISICFYILYLFSSKKKLLIIYLSALTISIGVLYVSNIYKIGKKSIFSFISDRGDEDSRTGVELYFYNDMKKADWILGKGLDGQYYCPDIDEGDTTGYRTVIETDYLQIILNGGLISLGLILLILVPAIILGLFYSKNILSKGAALWILIWIASLYPARVTTFTMHYLLVWISVGICYSKSIRNLPEKNIQQLFQEKIL